MEHEALQGAVELLSQKRIDAMFIEVTGGNFYKVKNILETYGYGLFTINEQLQPIQANSPLTQHTTVYISQPYQNEV